MHYAKLFFLLSIGQSSCTESVCTDDAMNNNICISGCGIVTSAMLLNFHGYEGLTPPDVATWMLEAGFRDDLSNTRHVDIPDWLLFKVDFNYSLPISKESLQIQLI